MSQLEKLAQHRDVILLAEIGAWLHMLGKYDWRFIESHCGGTTSYDYQNFVSGLKTQYPQLFELLDTGSSKYQAILSALPITYPSSVGVFIRDHRKTSEARQNKLSDQLTMLLVDAHGRGSNIEKSELNISFPGQTLPDIQLSTAFGYSKQLTAIDYKTNTLHQALNQLIHKFSTSTETNKWAHFCKQIRQEVATHFQNALAETRFPFNDVTLLDQTASTVAFFKAALAERVVANKWKPLIKGSTNQYKWRTLTIPFAGLEYLHAVSGITDLLGRQKILANAQNAVQNLLEITYPVGQEIYRDEQCSLFLVPDDNNLLQWQNSDGESLDSLIHQEIIKATGGDKLPDLQKSLLPQGTRTLYSIGQQIDAASSMTVMSDVDTITKAWQGVTNRQICTNCGLRPQGPSSKAVDRKICNLCLERRDARASEWASTQLNHTVWTDEVADNNGRLALLVGMWDLTEWLNGTLVNTIIAAPDIDFRRLKKDCCKSLQRTPKGTPQRFQDLLKTLLNKHVRQQFKNQFRGYFTTIIQPEWQHLSASTLPEEMIAAIHFVRQNPSFARLRRIWETTRRFWEEVLKNEDKNLIGTRPRIFLKGTPSHPANLAPYHAYELEIRDRKVAVLWVSGDAMDKQKKPLKYRGGFWVIENLEYLDRMYGESFNDIVTSLSGQPLQVYEPSEYGQPRDTRTIFTMNKVDLPEDACYTPVIPILAEPRTFMALVPADRALDIVQAIKTKYEREMGKVRNRLPLHLGVVFFHRRTPLRAALDAGRRMLKYELGKVKDDVWMVTNVCRVEKGDLSAELTKGTKQFDEIIAVTLEHEGRTLTWRVPAVMGDGQTKDNWYPYVFIQNDVSGRQPVFKALRPKSDGTSEVCCLVHAGELQEGDKVFFTPATFDFLWLDHGGRRFEIAYDENGRRRDHLTRPYLLDELETIQQVWDIIAGANGLTSSQIYALRDLVETKRESWQPTAKDCQKDGTLWKFCRDAVVNANWKKRPDSKKLELLSDWLASGLFTDVIQLYMGIMKQKPQREESDERTE